MTHALAVVQGFSYPVLLGTDFLSRVNAVLDFGRGIVTLTTGQSGVKLSVRGLCTDKQGPVNGDLNQIGERTFVLTAEKAGLSVVPMDSEREEQDEEVSEGGLTGDASGAHRNTAEEVDESAHSPPTADEKEDVELPSTKVRVSDELLPLQRRRLMNLIDDFADVFATGPGDTGRTWVAEHFIETGSHRPVSSPPYRTSPAERQEIQRQVDSMLEHGIVTESTSPWSSPVVLSPKNDGSQRFCVDFRRLNDMTVKDRYPLPRIDDILYTLNGQRFFTSLDMQSGYWQIPLAANSRKKTAFTTPDGLFEFTVLPFGVCNGPATFQRAMDSVLSDQKWRSCLVYLDDILLFSATFDEHLKRLSILFRRLRDFNLKLKPCKCQFAKASVKYLGHVISEAGISPDPAKIEAVSKLAAPKSKKELRSFTGLASYYRRFVKGFAEIALPLLRLLSDEVRYEWKEPQQRAFEALCQALMTSPVLVHPDWTQMFYVQTDASDYALGAVLAQRNEGGLEQVVQYLSRKLNPGERKWDTREKELLAVVWACETLRPYLIDCPFVIETDHANLRWLFASRRASGRLGRWVLRLQEYDFDVQFKPGRANTNADALSRLPTVDDVTTPDSEAVLAIGQLPDPPSTTELLEAQRQDPQLRPAMDFLMGTREDGANEDPPITVSDLLQGPGQYAVDAVTGLLVHEVERNGMRCRVPVAPAKCQRGILTVLHCLPMAAHLGRRKTYNKARTRYFWKGMSRDVRDFVRECGACQTAKSLRPKRAGRLQLFSEEEPFATVGVDLLGPLPRSRRGNKYVVVMVDRFTRWPELSAIPDATAETVADAVVEKIVLRHGCPKKILTDRGAQFTSRLFRRMTERMGVKKIFTTAYHPETNGQVERFNRFIGGALRVYTGEEHDDWDDFLEALAFAYRTSIVDVIGDTQFHLVYGRDARLPVDVLEGGSDEVQRDAHQYGLQVTRRIIDAHQAAKAIQRKMDEKRKEAHDACHHDVEFEEGRLVLLYTPVVKPGQSRKLQRKWAGPYRVAKKCSEVNYLIRHVTTGKESRVHVRRLRPFISSPREPASPEESDEERSSGEDESDEGVAEEGDEAGWRQ
eukprot:m.196972 g.196972  ORF g.196972 m.196972 type:complete len:1094 (+) comp39535_c1_seq2:160-3441(+)